jgi:uncharacterized Zn finger protein (UPF0148 family)
MDENRIECPYCRKKIADGITFCPYCGKKQPQALNKDEINKNPYEILQVSEEAEQEVIEAAYRSLARKYHPDSGTSSVSEEIMREINWAHGILSDPDKLAEWKLKHQRKQTPKSSATAQSTPITKPNPVRQSQSVYNPTPPISTGERSKKPSNTGSPLGWLLTIVIVSFVVICAVIFGFITQTNYQTSTPTTYIPTQFNLPNLLSRTPIITPTIILSNCILWSSVINSDVGYYRCVYGRIVEIQGTGQNGQKILFSNEIRTFSLWSTEYYFSDLTVDECVAAVGKIYLSKTGSTEYQVWKNSFIYMEISEIKLYEYNGCP